MLSWFGRTSPCPLRGWSPWRQSIWNGKNTVIKRLCERGVLESENATVRACITKREYLAAQSNRFVAEHFAGSIPMFLVSFQEGACLSEEDWDILRRMIAKHEEEK